MSVTPARPRGSSARTGTTSSTMTSAGTRSPNGASTWLLMVFADHWTLLQDWRRPRRPVPRCGPKNLGISPGGVANIAAALAPASASTSGCLRCSRRTRSGQYLWSALAYEGIDLSLVRALPGMDHARHDIDRLWSARRSLAVSQKLRLPSSTCRASSRTGTRPTRWSSPSPMPTTVGSHACIEYTPLVGLRTCHGIWSSCALPGSPAGLKCVDVFMPNAAEALACTGMRTVEQAATALASDGSCVVVKDAGSGADAIDPRPVPPARASREGGGLDTTGAGDVFDASFIYGSLAEWPLEERLRFANLCAAGVGQAQWAVR